MGEERDVLFYVANEVYGIDVAAVQGIEKYVNFIPVPNAPSYIEGLINLRGVVIPVFSIRNKFKLPEIAVTEETRMIIVRSKGVLIGLQVDKVKEIVELSDKDLIDPPGIVQDEETKYIRKIARVGDSLVLLMELDGILSAEQKKTIEDMVKEQ